MDFEDILNDWEKSKKQPQKQKSSGKKANAPEKAPSPQTTQEKDFQKRINPMDKWIRQHGTIDKDALAQKNSDTQTMNNRTSAKTLPIDARIDLHNLTQDEAISHLDKFITDCAHRHLKKVLIVHGKGNHSSNNPVLGTMVSNFIEHDKRLGASGHPITADGGKGATWVIIKSR